MSATLQFDEEASRRLEATYTTPDVVEQRRAIRTALALGGGENVLDIGSGPGLLACEMAAEVGAVGSVDGIDPSESMLALARGRRPPEGAAEIRFVTGDACALPFADESFDVAVATQVYEYARAAGCSCSTPTGDRSCGTQATPSACGVCSPRGMSTSSTPISLGG
jgi:SAM-dependent methyltransferase